MTSINDNVKYSRQAKLSIQVAPGSGLLDRLDRELERRKQTAQRIGGGVKVTRHGLACDALRRGVEELEREEI